MRKRVAGLTIAVALVLIVVGAFVQPPPHEVPSFGANGFNVEYQPTRRAVVIHCYLATPWVWRRPLTSFANAQPVLSLLLVPTSSLPAGPVSVVEDDRIEHLIGDQSTEHQMGTATIS